MKFTNRSILLAEEKVIAHGCNNRGRMNSGVGKAIREAWPRVFTAYEYAHASGGLHLGAVNWASTTPLEDRWVANVITQQTYGRDPSVRYVSYDAVDRGLRTVVNEGRTRYLLVSQQTIAVPLIGAGLANGSWPIIRAIMGQIEDDLNVQFNVYVPDEVQYSELSKEKK